MQTPKYYLAAQGRFLFGDMIFMVESERLLKNYIFDMNDKKQVAIKKKVKHHKCKRKFSVQLNSA